MASKQIFRYYHERMIAYFVSLLFVAPTIMYAPKLLQKYSREIFVFLLALTLRLCFLFFTVDQLPFEKLSTLSPDWSAYTFAAQKLLINGELNNGPINTYGPGYPVFLYLVCFFTGWAPVFALIIQCIISALCSIGIYLLAKMLIDDTRIAFVSGFLYALSPLSISLAGAILSETVFTALVLGALLLFLHGTRKQQYKYLLFSGLCLGAATLSRAQGQYLVFLLAAWSVLYWQAQKAISGSLFKTISLTVILVASALAVTGGWVAYNTSVYHLPYVSRAVPGACAKIGTFMAAELDNVPWQEKKKEFDSLVEFRVREEKMPPQKAYSTVAFDYLFSTIEREPWRSATWLLGLANTNTNFEDGMLRFQLPEWGGKIRFIEDWLTNHFLNYRIIAFSLMGMLFLCIKKRLEPAIFLGSLYLYFAALSAFTLWQGSRIMYPAIVAWSILIAVAVVWGFDWIRDRFKNGRKNADTTLPRHDTGLPDAAR